MRQRLVTAFSRFVDVRAMGDGEVADLLRSLAVDIAVDLKGHTDHARTGILARRAAPVQVSYLGYPGTLGAPFIDYLIADRIVVPETEEAAYSEGIVRLPDSYQANDPLGTTNATTRAEQELPESAVVLCAFHPAYKITPAVYDVWMRLLRSLEGSVLWLLEAGETSAANLRSEAHRRGIDTARLLFAPRVPHERHLARMACADLCVDTFPYNGHTTTSDALRVGLPVVTCRGRSFAARVAASLLTTVGMPELVTETLAHYEALILALATDAPRRQALRAALERQRARSPLFDPDRFCRHLEAAFETMWLRGQRGETPAGFSVPPLA